MRAGNVIEKRTINKQNPIKSCRKNSLTVELCNKLAYVVKVFVRAACWMLGDYKKRGIVSRIINTF